MRKLNVLILSLALTAALFACSNSSPTKEQSRRPGDSATVALKEKPMVDSANMPMRVTAMFVDFSQGDASHFVFKDEGGKTWDFGGDDDTTYKFAVELPKAKSNESNQGWSSNPTLQKAWFNLTYVYKNEPQYEGGPMAKVAVITHVEKR